MPDASMVVTLRDNYSSAAKKMADVTRHFSKDAEQLQKQLLQLDKNRYTLKLDARKAKEELREAEKQFKKTGSAADGLKASLANQHYENISRNLRSVTRAAREAEDQISRLDNRAGSVSTGKKITGALAAAGVGQMASQLLQQGGATMAGSAFGSQTGGILSGALSMAANGAAAGFMVGGPTGALVGGLAGAAGGALTGGLQAFDRKDDAFKSWVQENVGGVLRSEQDRLKTGSAIAGGRETDLIAFSTMLKDQGAAEGLMADMVDMANRTPFLFEDLKTMAKVLTTYQYGIHEMIPTLTDIGDAGSALGMDAQGMGMVATGLGRMRSSGKTTLEYLNLLQERGIDAIGYLAGAMGISNGDVYGRITKGQINGVDAARIIQEGMHRDFAGSMEIQSGTFAGLSSTVEGLRQEQAAAMGRGYNDTRKGGLQREIDWLSGESGAGMQEAYGAIGAWEASLENEKERSVRDALTKAMGSEAYLTAKEQEDAVTMGRLLKEAELQGVMDYNNSEGALLKVESEKALVAAVRNDASVREEYWNAGYELGKVYDLGIIRARMEGSGMLSPPGAGGTDLGTRPWETPIGLPAAAEVPGAEDAGGTAAGSTTVNVTGNTFAVREEADVDAVAGAILQKAELAALGA